jgi:hypothetical protein
MYTSTLPFTFMAPPKTMRATLPVLEVLTVFVVHSPLCYQLVLCFLSLEQVFNCINVIAHALQ